MYTRILVPVDGSDASEFGLLEAARLARLGGGTLRLLHVIDDLPGSAESLAYGDWPSERAQAALDHGHELLRRGAARAQALGARTETVLVEGRGRRLHEYVGEQVAGWPAELVVIGTHGRRGVQRLVLGSDAEDVVRHSDVPVLLVRHETPASKQAAGAADRAVAEGKADLVAFGRPFIANPDLVRRLKEDLPLAELDPATTYGKGAPGYTTYPALA